MFDYARDIACNWSCLQLVRNELSSLDNVDKQQQHACFPCVGKCLPVEFAETSPVAPVELVVVHYCSPLELDLGKNGKHHPDSDADKSFLRIVVLVWLLRLKDVDEK